MPPASLEILEPFVSVVSVDVPTRLRPSALVTVSSVRVVISLPKVRSSRVMNTGLCHSASRPPRPPCRAPLEDPRAVALDRSVRRDSLGGAGR